MGKILDSMVSKDGKFIYKILMDEDEVKHLYGNMKNVYLFSSNSCNNTTTVLERGNHKGTKYFIIPREIKTKQKYKPNKIFYQKIESSDKTLFVYAVDKK